MKVKNLIEELRKHDPEKMVVIQQGEEYEYTHARSVKSMEVWDVEGFKDDQTEDVVTINFE